MDTTTADAASKMNESVELVHKFIRILRARGMKTPTKQHDFGPLHQALGCEMPRDYQVLLNSLPNHTYLGLGMQVDIGLAGPEKILKMHQELQQNYQHPNRINLDWSNHSVPSFVPIASNSSAFYFGYVKEQANGNHNMSQLICLDGEGNLEWDGQNATTLPLGQVLYRMIVRAVTPDIWNTHGSTLVASKFWWSENEAEDYDEGRTLCARDGSQDHEASDEDNYVVLGRRVASTGQGDWDDEDIDPEDFEDDGNVFEGASEDDFLGVGEYGLTHPLDLEEEARQNAADAAVQVKAKVRLPPESNLTLSDLGFKERVYNDMDLELNQVVARAAVVENSLAVGHRASALVAEDGRLALVDYADERFVFLTEPNQMLQQNDNDEQFTHVAFDGRFISSQNGMVNQTTCCSHKTYNYYHFFSGDQHGFAFTSKGRLLHWKGYGQYEQFSWIPLPEDMGPIRQLASQEHNLAIVLQDGQVLFRGSPGFCHDGPPNPNTPYYLGNVEKCVRVYVSPSELFILHADGTVSSSSKSQKLLKLNFPVPIVALCGPGPHALFLGHNGCVYGYGQDGKGTLPRAVTPERIAEYQASQEMFDKTVKEVEATLEDFSARMTEHLQTCPLLDEQKRKRAKHSFPSLMRPGTKLRELHYKIQCARIVDGLQHTPEACGAPDFTVLEAELVAKLAVPPMPSLTTVHPPKDEIYPVIPMEAPVLLTVGPEHDRLMEKADALTPNSSWNWIQGPYGLDPGSVSPVIAVTGNGNASVFLHQDGTISCSGSDEDLVMGIDVSEWNENKEDDTVPRLPVVSRHTYSQTNGHCYVPALERVGIPVAADLPREDIAVIAVKVGAGGSMAVDSEGRVWGCGIHTGRSEPGAVYEDLEILDKDAHPSDEA